MAAAGSSGAAREVVEEEFSERELEVAAILADLPSIVRACNRRRRQQQKQQARPEIPSWGRRRPRKSPAAPPAAEKPAADDDGRNGAASPDTPLAFPEDDEHREAAAAAAAEDEAKARVQHKWAQEQRGVVAASLSHDNAHLLKQIEEFRARLQSSRSTDDRLSQIHHQSKHKKRHRPEGQEEEARRWRLQPRAAGRPALDLNEPAEADADDGKPPPQNSAAAQWFHHQQQHQQLMQLGHKAARRRRQEIRRAKAAASRVRRLG